jgi:predicted nucleotidyltransferase
MSNISNKTYKELGIQYFNDVFLMVDEVLSALKIPYYLVGVSAIALELLKDNIKPARGTKDIDFAIMISSMKQYDDVVLQLVSKGFTKVKAPWTLYHDGYNVAIDLLPFGQIEENDTINFTERHIDLHFLGFKETLEESVTISIEEKIAHIPPLHAMVVLKLIAWNDRPEERDNDLKDILLIIDKYYNYQYDEILSSHYDTFPEDEFDIRIIGARVLGRKAARILSKSDHLRKHVISILEKNSSNLHDTPIAVRWAREMDANVAYAMNLIKALLTGIIETANP